MNCCIHPNDPYQDVACCYRADAVKVSLVGALYHLKKQKHVFFWSIWPVFCDFFVLKCDEQFSKNPDPYFQNLYICMQAFLTSIFE